MRLAIRFSEENIENVLFAIKNSEKYARYSKFIKGEFWLDEMSDRQIDEFNILVKELELNNVIDATFIDGDTGEEVLYSDYSRGSGLDQDQTVRFEFDDVVKKIFVAKKSRIWQTELTVEYAVIALLDVEEFEDRFDKSVLEFDEQEVLETIKGLYNRHTLAALYSKVAMLSSYSLDLKGASSKFWVKNKSRKQMALLVGENQTISDIITKNNLKDYFRNSDNPQFSIIPILIFEGVQFSTMNDIDELRSIKRDDILENGIILRGGDKKSTGRFLELDQDVMSMVRIALNQKTYYGVFKRQVNPDFVETGYLFKPIGSVRANGSLSYSGIFKRFVLFQDYAEITLGIEGASVRVLQNFGKFNYLGQYLKTGMVFKEASVEVMKKYKEYEIYTPDGGKSKRTIQENNRTRTGRLKHTYISYGGSIQED